jgi:hypothetical protein
MLCFHFIPSTSISYPEHRISYQVSKFSYPKQPISYSSHFPLISLPDSLYVYIYLQLKELVVFADASYDQILLFSWSKKQTNIIRQCLSNLGDRSLERHHGKRLLDQDVLLNLIRELNTGFLMIRRLLMSRLMSR